jgi:glyoxylase-like metal-dependent hydrolase (beta-lactamase superfamily II)
LGWLHAEQEVSSRRRIRTIDCEYLYPEFAAAYLLIDQPTGQPASMARAAFIDNNTAHCVPLLLEALKNEGLTSSQVDFVIITHVHLDHAGGTSQLMKACPQATCLAHPRAAKHLIDPSKLIQSARQVYGDEPFERMYGKIEPIPASRVRLVEDSDQIGLGASGAAPLRFMHTRGHANHHMCIIEPETASIFTGDAFGLAYPALQRQGLLIFPTTSPTDFDYATATESVDRIVATGSKQAYPTHYGAVKNLTQAARQLHGHLDFSRDLVEGATQTTTDIPTLTAHFEQELTRRLRDTARSIGLELTHADLEMLHLDLELNAQGLAHVVRKRREAAHAASPSKG